MYYKKQDGNAFIKRYCNSSLTDKAAFAYGEKITIEFYIRVEYDPLKAFFYLGNDQNVLISQQIDFFRTEGSYHVFSATIDSVEITGKSKRGLFFYHFEAETNSGRLYTCTDGVNCTLEHQFCNEWQLSIYAEEFETPSWFNGGVLYQIFVDRFAKGDQKFRKGDALYNEDWKNGIPEFPEKRGDEYPNNLHFGGNLYAAADKMDYLVSLGITCVYLNPIFEAYSNHKYDTGDYLKVDASFGGDEAFAYFLSKAKEKGIAVILDGVFNHVGADSIYFNKFGKYDSVGAYQAQKSPYYNWFIFEDYPDGYKSWWGIRNLPKVKHQEEFERFICDQVIPKYMAMGVSGWRLDVVDELSGKFTERIVQSVKNCKKDALVIGEVWEDASNKIAYDERKEYFLGKQLDSVMNYPFRDAIIKYILHADAELLKLTLQTLYEHYPAHILSHIMNIVGTHDTVRILNVLSGEEDAVFDKTNKELSVLRLSEEKRCRAIRRLKNAYLLLAFLPGVPCIYYGDEVGLEGWHDPFNRRPFPWNEIDTEIHDWFARVNRLRAEEPLFKSEKLRILSTEKETFAVERYFGNNSIFLVSNMSKTETVIPLDKKSIDNAENIEYNHNAVMPPESIRVYKKADDTWTSLLN